MAESITVRISAETSEAQAQAEMLSALYASVFPEDAVEDILAHFFRRFVHLPEDITVLSDLTPAGSTGDHVIKVSFIPRDIESIAAALTAFKRFREFHPASGVLSSYELLTIE